MGVLMRVVASGRFTATISLSPCFSKESADEVRLTLLRVLCDPGVLPPGPNQKESRPGKGPVIDF